MTEQQQYRVIADRDKGDDPTWNDVHGGDRVAMTAGDISTFMSDEIVRIERPVPTTDEPKHQVMCLPIDVYEASIGMLRLHGAEATADMLRDEAEPPPLPTREQIAEAQRALTELGDAIALPDTQAGEDWFTERMGLVTDIFESVRALLQKGADRG